MVEHSIINGHFVDCNQFLFDIPNNTFKEVVMVQVRSNDIPLCSFSDENGNLIDMESYSYVLENNKYYIPVPYNKAKQLYVTFKNDEVISLSLLVDMYK